MDSLPGLKIQARRVKSRPYPESIPYEECVRRDARTGRKGFRGSADETVVGQLPIFNILSLFRPFYENITGWRKENANSMARVNRRGNT